ncbi:MAG: ECF transporter S component, partial [Oscillospiraceae bacterium]|nr:ECF transporter S component [Oscillospiraceae bacterium]
MKFTTKKLVTMALLSALAYASTFFFSWSFIPAAPYLTYDPKDVFIITGGFFFGPLAVVMMSATVSLVEMVSVSKDGIVGMVAN